MALKAQTTATMSNATKDAVVQKGLFKHAGSMLPAAWLYFHFNIVIFTYDIGNAVY